MANDCAACGFENPPGFGFCGKCGSALTGKKEPQNVSGPQYTQAPSPAPNAQSEELFDSAERRHITVLFCDLVDSTKLASWLDPEDLRTVVRQYQSAADTVVGLYQGHIAQYLGDGLLVYFGYPIAHENDAHRALFSALEIVDAISELNQKLEDRWGVHLEVRIGIHSGIVVAGEMGGHGKSETLAMGQTPNIAARLQGLAAPNEILLSAHTAELATGYFELDNLGVKALKGVDEQFDVFRLKSETDLYNRFHAATTQGLSPFVGRSVEIASFDAILSNAQEGSGQVVLLSGEPGIGKSRLLKSVRENLGEQARWITLDCSPYHSNSAMHPITDYIARTLKWQPSDTAEIRVAKLDASVRSRALDHTVIVPLLARLLSLNLGSEYPPLQLSAKQVKDQTFELLSKFFFGGETQQPVVLVLEDVHWIDPSTLEFIDFLVLMMPVQAALLVMTCRPEFDPIWDESPNYTEIKLKPLSQDDVSVMIDSLFMDTELPSWISREIQSRTDGVPVFVEELAKMLKGTVPHALDAKGAGATILEQAIPITLQDSLTARLDGLGEARDVAQLASLLGRVFDYGLLQMIWPGDQGSLASHLHRLLRDQVLVRKSEGRNARFRFRHALMQDAAYESLLKARRKQLHDRVASALIEHFPEQVAQQPEIVADHLTRANRIKQSIPYWLKSAQSAARRGALEEAINLFRRGLSLIVGVNTSEDLLRMELKMQAGLGNALANATHWGNPKVGNAFERAENICLELNDPGNRFRSILNLRMNYTSQARHRESAQQAQSALGLARSFNQPAALAQAHAANIHPSWHLGNYQEAQEHADAALAALAKLPDPDAESVIEQRLYIYSYVAQAVWVAGKPNRCAEILDLGEKAVARIHSPYATSFFRVWGGSSRIFLGDLDGFERSLELGYATADEHGFGSIVAWAQIQRGWLIGQRGDPESGLQILKDGLKAFYSEHIAADKSNQLGADQPFSQILLAQTQMKAEKFEAALDTLERSVVNIDQTGEKCHYPELIRTRGDVLLVLGRVEDAELSYHQAIELARKQSALSWELRGSTSLARLLSKQGHKSQAQALLKSVLSRFDEGLNQTDAVEAKLVLAQLLTETELHVNG